jgi:histidine triad (HIT) family protein
VTDCIFCKIAAGDIPANFVFEDPDVVAFRDLNPQSPVHVLVIPRKHIAGFDEVTNEDRALVGRVAQAAAAVARQEGVADSGFRIVVNRGPDAQQSVPHLHMHVLGGRAMTWPPG